MLEDYDYPHFNSLAPCGANHCRDRPDRRRRRFQLTRPVRGEPIVVLRSLCPIQFQLTRPVRGEPFAVFYRISAVFNFNSLAPCGANPRGRRAAASMPSFQLTRPVRGEPDDDDECIYAWSISTHSPRAGRTYTPLFEYELHCISTHSPRAGRTDLTSSSSISLNTFQLTRPVRGEPAYKLLNDCDTAISTHSPRAGRTRATR